MIGTRIFTQVERILLIQFRPSDYLLNSDDEFDQNVDLTLNDQSERERQLHINVLFLVCCILNIYSK